MQGPPEMGMIPDAPLADRSKGAAFSQLFGWIGNAQLGPFYLGPWGVLSFMSGITWFVMVGFWFWGQAGYSPAFFMRDLFYLSLDPPSAEYWLSIPPLSE